jgi:hypothetical protein
MHDEDIREVLAHLDRNSAATVKAQPALYDLLCSVDAIFRQVFRGAPVQGVTPVHELYISCHISFIAAVRLALSGTVSPTLAQLRCMLEAALYGYLLSTDSKLLDLWLNRHTRENGQKKCRDHIGSGQALNALRKADQGLHGRTKAQYEASITYGAHPLVLAIAPHRYTVQRSERYAEGGLAYFYTPASLEVVDILIACVDVSLTCLMLCGLALPNHTPATEAAQAINDVSARLNVEVQGLLENLRGTDNATSQPT